MNPRSPSIFNQYFLITAVLLSREREWSDAAIIAAEELLYSDDMSIVVDSTSTDDNGMVYNVQYVTVNGTDYVTTLVQSEHAVRPSSPGEILTLFNALVSSVEWFIV